MKGTFDDGLPSARVTRPVGSFSVITMVLASFASSLSTKLMSFWPMASLAPQRLIEATQSSAVTGAPLCQVRPSRSTIVCVFWSDDTSYLPTICGWTLPFASIANSVS